MPRFRQIKTNKICEAFCVEKPLVTPEWFGNPEITDKGINIPMPFENVLANWGDWVIKNKLGIIYTCPPNVFKELYKPIEEENYKYIHDACERANSKYWRDSRKQEEDYRTYKDNSYKGTVPQHMKGSIIEYYFREIVEAIKSKDN